MDLEENYLDIDEDDAQIIAISDQIAKSIIAAFQEKFLKIEAREARIIFLSINKVMGLFLMGLPYDQRLEAINTILRILSLLASEIYDDQNV